MKIAVCFKVVTDYDKASPKELKRDDFSYVKKDIGFFDNGALELALHSKEENGSYIEAITIGECDEISFKKLYQLGFDKVTQIKGNEVSFSPREIANILASYLKGSFDLVLLGEMVGPNDSGSVPYYLSNYLGYSLINRVSNFDDKLIYHSDKETQINSKYVLVVSNSIYPYLRFPLYKDLSKGDKEVNIVKLNSIKSPKTKLKEIVKKDIKYINNDELIEKIKEVIND